MTAINMAEKARYGLQLGSGPRNSNPFALGGGEGEAQQGWGMLQDPADCMKGHFRETRIAVPCKQVLIALPEGNMNVHAAPVVSEKRLRHEGHGLSVLLGRILDDVLVLQHIVGHLNQRTESHIDLRLACG